MADDSGPKDPETAPKRSKKWGAACSDTDRPDLCPDIRRYLDRRYLDLFRAFPFPPPLHEGTPPGRPARA
jgi:hypothetical protein